ncbi:MAG: regulator [Pseudomonadota bacterium]
MTKLTRREGLAAMGAVVGALSLSGNSSEAAAKAAAAFDQSNVKWNTLEGADHVWYHILNVDRGRKVVDVLFKFAANERVFLHRHHADYSTFIIQGELRLYNAEGDITEIRPTASFVQKSAGGPPHTEGGGYEDCIAWFSNVGTDGVIYEILDPDGNTVNTLGFSDFEALWSAQPDAVQPLIPG